jgi:hypothetical protein
VTNGNDIELSFNYLKKLLRVINKTKGI